MLQRGSVVRLEKRLDADKCKYQRGRPEVEQRWLADPLGVEAREEQYPRRGQIVNATPR